MPRRQARFHHPLMEWLPVVAVLALFGGTYFIYVHVLCATMVKTVALRVFLVVAFHALFFLCAWSFVHTTLTDFAPIPVSFNVTASERERLQSLQDFDERRRYLDELGDKRGILTLGPDGCVRYCGICGRIKPDRTHHCSWCGRCVPKMDHHCPWFNNCVSFTTQKSFLLTLVYASALAAFTATTSVVHAVTSWFSLGFSLATLSVNGLVAAGAYLSIALACFFSHHMNHLFRNITTLESMRAMVFREPEDSFDIGRPANIVQVFGPAKWLWAFPVFTTLGDGVRFPTRIHPDPYNLQLPLVRTEKDAPGAMAAVGWPRLPLLPAAPLAVLANAGTPFGGRLPAPGAVFADYPRMPLLVHPGGSRVLVAPGPAAPQAMSGDYVRMAMKPPSTPVTQG